MYNSNRSDKGRVDWEKKFEEKIYQGNIIEPVVQGSARQTHHILQEQWTLDAQGLKNK